MTVKLSVGALSEVSKTAAVPAYDPGALKPGIVHFGVGNFHRAHQAVYLDDLFNLGGDHDWALIGAGVRPTDEDMRQKLLAQNLLTTVVEQEADQSTARVTASMIGWASWAASTMKTSASSPTSQMLLSTSKLCPSRVKVPEVTT